MLQTKPHLFNAPRKGGAPFVSWNSGGLPGPKPEGRAVVPDRHLSAGLIPAGVAVQGGPHRSRCQVCCVASRPSVHLLPSYWNVLSSSLSAWPTLCGATALPWWCGTPEKCSVVFLPALLWNHRPGFPSTLCSWSLPGSAFVSRWWSRRMCSHLCNSVLWSLRSLLHLFAWIQQSPFV